MAADGWGAVIHSPTSPPPHLELWPEHLLTSKDPPFCLLPAPGQISCCSGFCHKGHPPDRVVDSGTVGDSPGVPKASVSSQNQEALTSDPQGSCPTKRHPELPRFVQNRGGTAALVHLSQVGPPTRPRPPPCLLLCQGLGDPGRQWPSIMYGDPQEPENLRHWVK